MNPFSFIKNFFLKFNKEKIAIHKKQVKLTESVSWSKSPTSQTMLDREFARYNSANTGVTSLRKKDSEVPYDSTSHALLMLSALNLQNDLQNNSNAVSTVEAVKLCESVKDSDHNTGYSSYTACSSNSSSDDTYRSSSSSDYGSSSSSDSSSSSSWD